MTQTITLGGNPFEVTAAPLGKIVELADCVDIVASKSFNTPEGYAATLKILTIGLMTKSPDAIEMLETIPVTLQELKLAVEGVLIAAGLSVGGDTTPGEAVAQ